MSESSITTGELFYHVHEIGKHSPGLNNFRKFLGYDIDQTALQSEYATTREYLQKCRLHFRKNTETILRNASDLIRILKLRRNRAIALLSENEELICSDSREIISSIDQRLMDIVLMYGSVIMNELEAQSANNKDEIEAIEAIRRQEIIANELRVFSKYLDLETKGLMKMTFLEKDNEQYKRCKKAIKDNINSKALRDGNFQGVRVLNICSLQNGRLARFLQTAVKNDEGGKVKGLFCAVPKKSVYSLCVRGLHLKKDDSLNAYQSGKGPGDQSNSVKKGCRVPVNAINNSRKMFEWSWMCYPPSFSFPPPTSPRKSLKSPIKRNGDALRPSSSHDLSVSVRGVGSAMHIANESPPLQNDPQRNVRFTRSSTPCDLFTEEGISDEGCFVALCRVLVSRVFKVEDRITASVFLEAARNNYDTIYSEKRDEYVFIKPNHVLPEFLMHVQIVKQPGTTTNRKSTDKSESIPRTVLPVPQIELEENFSNEISDGGSPSKESNSKKLNEWVYQLDNALNSGSSSGITTTAKSKADPLTERLISLTEEAIHKLKKSSSFGKHDDVHGAMQVSMQHKRNLFLSVEKTIEQGSSNLQKNFQEKCKKMTLYTI